jgi:hypothetical protein
LLEVIAQKNEDKSLGIMEVKMNDTKKLVLIIIAIGVLFASGVAKDKIVTSTWCPTPLKVDGTSADWQGVAMTFEKKVQVDYAFMNDADYLYVFFVFKDPEYLSSINQTGMMMYFDVAGKKKKDYGLKFIQKRISATEYIALLEQQQGPLSETDKNNILSNPHYAIFAVDVVNKKAKDDTPRPPADARAALYRMQQDQEKNVAIEFAVPLARVSELAPGIGTEPGKKIKVGFEWGGMTEAMKKARMSRFKSQSERSAEKVSEQPAGGTSASTARGRRSPKKYDFWVDVQLASQK